MSTAATPAPAIVAEKVEEPLDMDVLLKSKIKLNDGSEEFLFSRGPKYNDKLWPIQCHLCRVGYMVNEKKLRAHLNSEKHSSRVAEGPPDAEVYRKPYEQLYSDRMRLMNPIKIYPGELIEEVTTKHADRLMPCKYYNWEDSPPQEMIDELINNDIIMEYNEKSPILGLCYAFKMYDSSKKIKYFCSMCSAFFGEHNAYQHFAGIEANHVTEYINRHFSTLKAKLETLFDKSVKEADKTKWTRDIIRHVYGKLEGWKGFRKMHIVDGKLFDTHRQRFLAKARKLLHYGDQAVHFSDTELRALIQKCKNFGKLYPKDPDRLVNQPPALTKAEMEADKKAEEQNKRKLDSKDNSGGTEKKVAKLDNNNSNNKNNNQRSGPKLNETPENWARYGNLVDRALRSLNDEYGNFVDMSENHPQYRAEWHRFWRGRSMELEEDNIDPNNYDFMPEWNRYWIRYLENCYQSDVKKCKFEIRKTLRLPFRQRTPEPSGSDRRRGNNNNNNNNNNISRPSMPLQLSSGFDGPNRGGNNNAGGGNNMNRSNRNQNNNNNNNNFGENRQAGPMPLMGIGTIITPEPSQQQQEIEIPTESLSVLSVLRLLTALEDQLGSLGPTAIQLLSKAIFFEKDSNSSANELLNESEYFKLFITSLEKLKGQLMARIVPEIRIKAVKKAVTDLDNILTLFEEYKHRISGNSEKEQQQQQSATSSTGEIKSGKLNERNQSGNLNDRNQSGNLNERNQSGNLNERNQSGNSNERNQSGNLNDRNQHDRNQIERNQNDRNQSGNHYNSGERNSTGVGMNIANSMDQQWRNANNSVGRELSGNQSGNGTNWRSDKQQGNTSPMNNNSGSFNWRQSLGGNNDNSGGNNYREDNNSRQFMGNNQLNSRGNNNYGLSNNQDNFSSQNRNNDFNSGNNSNMPMNSRNDNYNSGIWNTYRNQTQSTFRNNMSGGGGGGNDNSFGNLNTSLQSRNYGNDNSPQSLMQNQQMGGGGGNRNFSNFNPSAGQNSGFNFKNVGDQQYSSNNSGSIFKNRY